MNRVVLYRAEPIANSKNWWKTDAGLDSNGDIHIISGDGKIEWHMTIAANDLPSLKVALSRQQQGAAESDTLTLLAEKFTANNGDGNPYDAIQIFLERENIRHKITTW